MNKTVINVDFLNKILKDASLGCLSSNLNQLTNGWTNITIEFSIEPDHRRLIVRQYVPGRFRSINRENIEFELKFVKFLFNELKLPVVCIIEPPGLLTVNNDTFIALFPFIHGIKHLDTAKNPSRKLWQTLEISRFLGRMHSNFKTNKYKLSEINRCSINYVNVKYELIHGCHKFSVEYPDLYKRIIKLIEEKTTIIPLTNDKNEQIHFQNELQKKLPVGYIHADLHDDNVLFNSIEDKLSAVLDFDDMYIGPLLIDISMTLCLWSSVGAKFDINYGRAFLSNYEKEREMRLTNEEWNLLEIYCYLTTLNQVLFIIEVEKDRESTEDMINDLLLPLECIGQEKKFLENLQLNDF